MQVLSPNSYTFLLDFHSLIEENNYMFPTNEDMEGAKDALLRLQETFSLSAHEIVEGISKDVPIAKLGIKVTPSFDWKPCLVCLSYIFVFHGPFLQKSLLFVGEVINPIFNIYRQIFLK